MDEERVPVIIGVGEAIDRPETAVLREPAALMADALRAADADAGGGWLGRVGSLDVVNTVSWRYRDVPGRVAALVGTWPARMRYGPVGGETPVRFLHEAALRIAGGSGEVAAVCGGEAQQAVNAARRAGAALPWPEEDPAWAVTRSGDMAHPLARVLDVAQPTHVYPFYETACQAAWGETPAQGRDAAAALWSGLSDVAVGNPVAWLRRPHAAREIAAVSAGNRMVAWPYVKLMVANPGVNQGAAVLVTSLARARAAGVPARQMVFPGMGAAAAEPADYLQRPRFDRSPAMEAVLHACLGVRAFDHVELYSCFPCVPRMAMRVLGLPDDAAVTVTGGLTFFGAPLNDYMLHAACAMVRRVREMGGTGLLYGQGGFVSRHHGLVVSAEPGTMRAGADCQAVADAQRGAGPAIVVGAEGPAVLEAHTVLYGRDGAPRHGVAMVRLADGSRALARVPVEDAGTMAFLQDWSRSAVGTMGRLRPGAENVSAWAV